MNKILDIVEDIKQNITDNQYKTIMESLMEINNKDKIPLLTNNQERYKFVCLFNWLDSKLEITEDKSNCIDKERLEKHIVFNYFEFFEYEIFNSKNVDFVKKVLKVYIMFSTKKQDCHYQYQYVKLRNEE